MGNGNLRTPIRRTLAALLSLAGATALLFAFATEAGLPLIAGNDGATQAVFLFQEDDRLFATGTARGGFRELRLGNNERVLHSKTAEQVALVITSRRWLAFSGLSGRWHGLKRQAGEQLQQWEAAGALAVIVSSRRLLDFDGRRWSQRSR